MRSPTDITKVGVIILSVENVYGKSIGKDKSEYEQQLEREKARIRANKKRIKNLEVVEQDLISQ